MLNPTKGNMYDFITHTWNPIKGICSHGCEYCYMKMANLKPLRLDKKEMKTNLGEGNFIFVGSSTDMWADDVWGEWIKDVLDYCKQYDNLYLFQTKNPQKYHQFISDFPEESTLCVTIETNQKYDYMGNTKTPFSRAMDMALLPDHLQRMVTVEPIMEFDLDTLAGYIRMIKPKWVNIGADSKGHHLPEPTRAEVDALINELSKFTEIKEKRNLARLK